MAVFTLGAVGGCESGTPCGCGESCPNTWRVCVIDGCTGEPLDGADIVVTDSADTAIDTCTTSAGAVDGPTGPNYASTCANSSGSPSWTNASNATANDGSNATITSPGTSPGSAQLQWTGFGFSVPSDATIDGIVFEVYRSSTAPAFSTDTLVKLLKAGTAVGTDKANSGALTTGIATYGSSTDLWGTTWTPTDINDANFGAQWGALGIVGTTISVDYGRITVYWSGGTLGDGCCTFDLPTEDTYTATVSKTGYFDQAVSIEVGCNNSYGTTVSLMPDTVERCFELTDGCTGDPIVGATITVTGETSGTTDSFGIWCMKPTSAGTKFYTIDADCFGTTSGSFDACTGGTIALTAIGRAYGELFLTDCAGTYSFDSGDTNAYGLLSYPTSAHAGGQSFTTIVPCVCTDFGLTTTDYLPDDYGTHTIPIAYTILVPSVIWQETGLPVDPAACEWVLSVYVPSFQNQFSSAGACCEDTIGFDSDFIYNLTSFLQPVLYEARATPDPGCPNAVTFTFASGVWSKLNTDSSQMGEPPCLTVTVSE